MIIHFTTVHQRHDTRIHLKEIRTLAKRWPRKVALFVQDGKATKTIRRKGIRYVILARQKGAACAV